MLKQKVRNTLEFVVQSKILCGGGSETLAYDISKQCISDEDVEVCLGAMLEHVSEKEIEIFNGIFDSESYNRYTQGVQAAMTAVDDKIYQTLKLLREDALGEA